MDIDLPDAVRGFFARGNGAAQPPLEECFSADAVVHDEGGTYRGHADIAAWQQAVRAKYAFTAEPREAISRDGSLIVHARVSGTFPGSPATIGYAFRLEGGRIVAVDIG